MSKDSVLISNNYPVTTTDSIHPSIHSVTGLPDADAWVAHCRVERVKFEQECQAYRATQPPDILQRLADRAHALWPHSVELTQRDAAVLALKAVGMLQRDFGYLLGASAGRVSQIHLKAKTRLVRIEARLERDRKLALLLPDHPAWMLRAPQRAATHPDFREQSWTPQDQYEETMMGRSA